MTSGLFGGRGRYLVLGLALVIGLATIWVIASAVNPTSGGAPVVHRLSGSMEHTGVSAPSDLSSPSPDTGVAGVETSPSADAANPVNPPSDMAPAAPIITGPLQGSCRTGEGHKHKGDHRQACPAPTPSWGNGGGSD